MPVWHAWHNAPVLWWSTGRQIYPGECGRGIAVHPLGPVERFRSNADANAHMAEQLVARRLYRPGEQPPAAVPATPGLPAAASAGRTAARAVSPAGGGAAGRTAADPAGAVHAPRRAARALRAAGEL